MIKQIILIFIFIGSNLFAQSNMFWNVIDMSFDKMLLRFGNPDKIEYQTDGSYFMAYDYGYKSVIYVINKSMVSSVLYIEEVKVYDEAKKSFINWNNISEKDGFITTDMSVLFFQKNRENIQLRAKLVENFDSFFIAIEIKKI